MDSARHVLSTMTSLLDVVRECQNDNPWEDTSLRAFCVDGVQIGFVPERVLSVIATYLANEPSAVVIEKDVLTFRAGADAAQRSRDMARLVEWMRDTKQFPDPLDGRLRR